MSTTVVKDFPSEASLGRQHSHAIFRAFVAVFRGARGFFRAAAAVFLGLGVASTAGDNSSLGCFCSAIVSMAQWLDARKSRLVAS